jgi:LPXTG-motif cell wall-anchored protein
MFKRNAAAFAVGAVFLAQVAVAQTPPAATPPAATTTTTTTVKRGVVVWVSGNTLYTKESDGVTRQHNIPEGFLFQMGGKNVPIGDLKPGDKITAVITETTTVQPVNVSRVVKGTVVESSMGSILVRNSKGQLIKYSSKDEQGRDVKIIQNGKEIPLGDLKAGDQLTATIITNYPPQVSSLTSATAKVTPPPPPPAAQPAPAQPAPVVAAAPAPKPAKLPKTGSPLPLVGLVGGALVLVGVGLTLRRRSRVAR